MNWKGLLFVIIVCSASGFAGAWLAMNRDSLPAGLGGGVDEPVDKPWVNEIVTRVNQLEQQNAELKESLSTAEGRMTEIETVFVASGLDIESTAEQIEHFRASLAETDSRLSKVDQGLSSTREELDEFQTEKEREEQQLKLEDFVFIDPNPINGVVGPHIIFQGANVHIQSGTGATLDLSGVGNLFIGYNEGDGPRFGSHNLVIGPGHNYTSYGGLLAGESNSLNAPSATISGGTGNVAEGFASIICGGEANSVTGDFATVVGGDSNLALGAYANVTGGRNNRASGEASVVYGGANSNAQARLTAVIGSLGRSTTNENQVVVGQALNSVQ